MTAQKHAIRGVEALCGKQNKYDFVSDFKTCGLIKMPFSFSWCFFVWIFCFFTFLFFWLFFFFFFSLSQTKSAIEIQHVWLPVSQFHPGRLLISLYNIHSNNKERKENQFQAFSFSFCHLLLPAGPLSIKQASSFFLYLRGQSALQAPLHISAEDPSFARF